MNKMRRNLIKIRSCAILSWFRFSSYFKVERPKRPKSGLKGQTHGGKQEKCGGGGGGGDGGGKTIEMWWRWWCWWWRENNKNVEEEEGKQKRSYIDPTSTLHRPHIDPIKTIKMRRKRKNNQNEVEEEEEGKQK